MKKLIRKLFLKFCTLFYKEPYVHFLGVNKVLVYAFFQRILRVNAKVEWPVHWASMVSAPNKITLADKTVCPGLMPGCYIQAINGISIGKNVIIAAGTKIVSAGHDLNHFSQHIPEAPIKIGDNCWLSANCVILPGVTLGPHTIVAAGAVVTKSFEEGNCVIGGVPAKKIKDIDDYKI